MASPLEQFDIKPILPLNIGGLDATFTNAAAWMVAVVAAISFFMILGMRSKALVPGRWQSMVEMTYEFVGSLLRDNVGDAGRAYFPFIFTLFIFILVSNLAGLLPFSFTVTSHLAVTFAFAALIFIGTLGIGLARHGFGFFAIFLPKGSPIWLAPLIVVIEIISFLSRPITLSIRLFANMTAGHILLKVFAGFIISLGAAGGVLSVLSVLPLIMNVALSALELLVAGVQAYVFALLTCFYLADAIHGAH